MRIVHIGPANIPVTHELGGAIERRIMELARAQALRGHHVIVYSADAANSVTSANGVELRSLVCHLPSAFRTLKLSRVAARQLRDEAVDVIHFHSVPEGAFLARRIEALKVLSYDNYRFRRGRATPLFQCYREMLARFDLLLPVSEYCRSESIQYWNLNPVHVHVLHNGVNLEQFRPGDSERQRLRRHLGITDEPVLLYVGRVCEQKGTDLLLDAYARVKRHVPNLRLVVIGPALRFGNRGGSDLTRRITEEGGIYMGAIPEGQLAAAYNAADIFVMPTRTDEMFGMAALEAQACGKPVVCSYHGGLPEVVAEASGLFFSAGDAAALADCIGKLIESPGLRQYLSSAASRNAARFGWQLVAARAECLYRGANYCSGLAAQVSV